MLKTNPSQTHVTQLACSCSCPNRGMSWDVKLRKHLFTKIFSACLCRCSSRGCDARFANRRENQVTIAVYTNERVLVWCDLPRRVRRGSPAANTPGRRRHASGGAAAEANNVCGIRFCVNTRLKENSICLRFTRFLQLAEPGKSVLRDALECCDACFIR